MVKRRKIEQRLRVRTIPDIVLDVGWDVFLRARHADLVETQRPTEAAFREVKRTRRRVAELVACMRDVVDTGGAMSGGSFSWRTADKHKAAIDSMRLALMQFEESD